MKKILVIFGVMILIFLVVGFLFFKAHENSWIKDSRGVYVKHGNPSTVPDYVLQQQKALNASIALYELKKSEGMDFNSQCLGTIKSENISYAVDIVHVPRIAEDNIIRNQCMSFLNRSVSHFVELDGNGTVVRTV